MKAAHADPQLRAAQASHMARVESTFASALAERLGTDPDRDPYPLLLASAAIGVLRATMSFWRPPRSRAARSAHRRAFRALATGFGEDCTLRDLAPPTGQGHRKRYSGHRKDHHR